MDPQRLPRLIDAGRSLLSELDLDRVLERLLEVAREVTGARYAAVGVLDEQREQLERFLTSGIDPALHREIGDLPRGRGVLGVLISRPRPLRLESVSEHPDSYGFPLGHPRMETFLGVPVVVRGEAWGNLYLTEKAGGEPFTQDDEDAVIVLADWAAIAITNARLYREAEERRTQAERALRGLETTSELSRAIAGELDLGRILELAAKRARALVHARLAVIELVRGDEIVVAALAGQGHDGLATGSRLPLEGSLVARAVDTRRVQRFDDLAGRRLAGRPVEARSALVAPMVYRGRALGALVLLDTAEERAFTDDDSRLLEAFAASAATAVATAQNAAEQGLRRALAASDGERRRWARELHDETLQELAGLRLLLSSARRSRDPERTAEALDAALERIGDGIANLRALITDLRPASLDELGTGPALEALTTRVAAQTGLEIDLDLDLAFERGRAAERHVPELESALYRLAQEALTNAIKHAEATRVEVRVADLDGEGIAEVVVHDDGRGFEPGDRGEGFGLIGMRERATLAGGELAVTSQPGRGTTVRARLPIRRRAAEAGDPLARAAG